MVSYSNDRFAKLDIDRFYALKSHQEEHKFGASLGSKKYRINTTLMAVLLLKTTRYEIYTLLYFKLFNNNVVFNRDFFIFGEPTAIKTSL